MDTDKTNATSRSLPGRTGSKEEERKREVNLPLPAARIPACKENSL
jgi:hypothetical protein